jgi:hypothetical protein
MTSTGGEYEYAWWEEHGRDPFAGYLTDEQDRRDLESKINVAVNLAINRPADPDAPNLPLIELAKEVKMKYGSTLFWMFFRVAAIPDPLQMEEQRRRVLKERRRVEKHRQRLAALTDEERAKYHADLDAARRATHSGHWTFHDDDCLCWRYFEGAHCNRNGYNWSCCGALSESSACCQSAAPVKDPLEVSDDEGFGAPF